MNARLAQCAATIAWLMSKSRVGSILVDGHLLDARNGTCNANQSRPSGHVLPAFQLPASAELNFSPHTQTACSKIRQFRPASTTGPHYHPPSLIDRAELSTLAINYHWRASWNRLHHRLGCVMNELGSSMGQHFNYFADICTQSHFSYFPDWISPLSSDLHLGYLSQSNVWTLGIWNISFYAFHTSHWTTIPPFFSTTS